MSGPHRPDINELILLTDPTTLSDEELDDYIRATDRMAIELKLLVHAANRRKGELRLEVYRRRHE